ncbi:ribosome-associated translation inhibitor RaiA [bacterium]|nr:ribosome-associated translation inhibitor RaiA [bacterium]
MQIIITGKNIEITDALRDYIQKKISKLSRFSQDILKAEVVLEVQRNWQKVEVTLRGDGFVARGEEKASDMYASVDAAANKLEKQLKRFKEKSQRKARVEHSTASEEPLIVRRKIVSLRPMSEAEAVEQMELLGHDFFLFLNTADNKPSLVYKRRGGGYGLITTE